MKEIINKLSVGLDVLHYWISESGSHWFLFEYQSKRFALCINNIEKIINPLLIPLDIKPNMDIHLESCGEYSKACLGIDRYTKVWTCDELLISIADWINNAITYSANGSIHTHGFRHGYMAFVEYICSKNIIPFNKNNILNLSEEVWKEIICLAQNSYQEKLDLESFKNTILKEIENEENI